MAYKSLFNGIIFIEGDEEYSSLLGNVEYKKEGFYNNQLKNLDNVKSQLADKAKLLGANAVIEFKYGQKSTTWLRSMILRLDDNINWYGSGIAVKIDDNKYNEYTKQINSRDQ